MPHILLVDDEETLRESLGFTLRREGYQVTTAADGRSALELARAVAPDIILLDLMLPGLDGVEVCRRIRARSSVPILMLTAKDQVDDKVLGLRIGADDYVTKPFSTRELLARISAVLRRADAERESAELARARARFSAAPAPTAPAAEELPHQILTGGPVWMDVDRHEVRVRDQVVDLSPKEFRLLQLLLENRGRVVERNQIIATVWGDDFMGDVKTVGVHIRWLREKVEEDPARPRHIVTLHAVGYRFDD